MEEELPLQTEIATLTKQLPAINNIADDGVKNSVVKVWVKLWRESPYHDLSQAPNYTAELNGDETLVRHTNAVTEMAQAAAMKFQQAYGISLNTDILLAGALLHDVDKLVLYERKGRLVQLNELGHKVVHGEYGAYIAKQVGLPREVINIIASHSFIQRKTLPATIEAVLVASCDEANFQAYRLMIGKGLFKKT